MVSEDRVTDGRTTEVNMPHDNYSREPEDWLPDDILPARLHEWSDRLSTDPAALSQRERQQQFDERLAAAMHEIPLPAGLAERINARLKYENAPTIVHHAGVKQEAAQASYFRRKAFGWLATAAAVLLIATAGYVLTAQPRWNLPQVLDRTIAFHEQRDLEPRDLTAATLPFSGSIRRPASAVGRHVSGLLGCEGAAFDIRRGKVRATLYVLRLSLVGLPTSPPARPDSMTADRCVAAWQEGDLVYVLVVEGGQGEYRTVTQRVVT